MNEKLSNVQWGEYSYTDFFKIVTVSEKLTKSELSVQGKTPVFSSITGNNGIIGYTEKKPTFLVENKNDYYLIFGDHTRTFNVTNESFSVMDNVKVLIPIVPLQLKHIHFIISVWRKTIQDKGYARHWSIAKKSKFLLPLNNGNIDYNFMDSFIADLESQHVAELEAYLTVTGLKNYELTKEEHIAIERLNTINWEKEHIINVFNVCNTKSILSRDIVPNSGHTPYLSARGENNSVSSYIEYDESLIDKGNCIFIGGKTFVVTYQEKDFYSNDSHNLGLYLNEEGKKTKENQLFLVTCIKKGLDHKYTWGDSVSNKKIQKDIFSVPMIENELDFEFMNTLIRAIQKLVIKDVVLWADRKIEATKQVIKK